ncbi:hypothetical protein OG713_03730 [Streptomyces sp. NBC_00723]|uniref:hypothetical protein n=1 Tax=Streptomyces sp. NBC_00723 TaxID=2903673 RepID=UPI003866A26B
MVLDTTVLQVLADTRCADHVIRLTEEAAAIHPDTNTIEMSEVFLHEWVHYFQFSGTVCGIMLSQYRRNCFTSLKSSLAGSGQRETVADDHLLEPFFNGLASFRGYWEAWPDDWYKVESAGRRDVREVRLRGDALQVTLEDSALTFTLPIGLHAVFEAHAWCAARLSQADQPIPRGADSLVYTWPLWLRAVATGVNIDELPGEEIGGVLPLLLIACNYDYRLMPQKVEAFPDEFLELWDELTRRKVTVGRLVFQVFSDYERFWKNPLSMAGVDAYLSGIGLPPLSRMLEQAAKVLEVPLRGHLRDLADLPKNTFRENLVLADDIFVEIDLLRTSIANLHTIQAMGDHALASPIFLCRDLVPVVCAMEKTEGYQWFSITPFTDVPSERWGVQGSRVILREQLSISEHVLMQVAFGANLACYGSFDWRRPIDPCPMAEECMNRPDKRGISFCEEPAWRRLIAVHVSGVFNIALDSAEAPEGLIPGIGEAMREAQAVLRGELPAVDPTPIDYGALGLGAYVNALRGDMEPPTERPHTQE